MITAQTDHSNAYKAAGLTLLVLVITGLILFFVRIFTPNPPFPELPGGGGGVEVSLGYSDNGRGDDNVVDAGSKTQQTPQKEVDPTPNTEKVTPTTNAVSTQTMTSEDPDAVALEKQKKAAEKVAQEQKVNDVAMFKKKTSTGSGSKGDGDKDGVKGKANGDPLSHNYNGDGGSGGGSGGGHGGGNGTGEGLGTGPGKGGGPSVGGQISGRVKHLVIPQKSVKSGTIVVEVTIDEAGNVTSLRAGIRGSSTNDPVLMRLAEKAAQDSKFKAGNSIAKGTITYVFVNK